MRAAEIVFILKSQEVMRGNYDFGTKNKNVCKALWFKLLSHCKIIIFIWKFSVAISKSACHGTENNINTDSTTMRSCDLSSKAGVSIGVRNEDKGSGTPKNFQLLYTDHNLLSNSIH
jgi:hypothetical protein